MGKKSDRKIRTKKKLNQTILKLRSCYKMSNISKMNINDFQTKVMEEISAIRAIVEDLKGSSAPTTKKERKPRKPRDPDAPKNPWIVFTGKVRAALTEAGKPAGKECQQFASYLKQEFPDAYQMENDEILAAHDSWTPPPPKPKEPKDEPKSDADADSKPKRKPLSEEHKAKMLAGRKAAAERRKAESAAANSADSDSAEVPVPAPAPAPAPPKTGPTLRALPFKSKKYLWDPEGNGMWENKDGVKGAWAGMLSKDKKSIDTSATDYTA
jgi:hypothetical protein